MKGKRQEAILELVKKYEIETQEELAEKLGSAGFAVTQATISRDIRELKLTKIQHGSKQIYAALTENKFSNSNKDYEAFVYDKNYNRIVINVNSGLMTSFSSDTAKLLFIISLIDNYKGQSTEDIYKRMKKFKNSCEIDEII